MAPEKKTLLARGAIQVGDDGFRVKLGGPFFPRWETVYYDTIVGTEEAENGKGESFLDVAVCDGSVVRIRTSSEEARRAAREIAQILARGEAFKTEIPPFPSIRDRLAEFCGARGFRASAAAEFILANAIEQGASDVHLEPARGGHAIRFRVDGDLAEVGEIPGAVGERFLSRLKILAGVLPYRSDVPQEGRIDFASARTGKVSVRASFVPTVGSERITLRMFDLVRGFSGIADLGFSARALEVLDEMLALGSGLLLISGPSASGKTTTMYMCLKRILEKRGSRVRVVSIEDPVEHEMAGVGQIPVQPRKGNTFAKVLSSVLRQDVEVIAVGEIRDPEGAEIAIRASLTGHLILSTVHAGSVPEALLRLADLRVDPIKIASSLRMALSQRLVPKLCPRCREIAPGSASDNRLRERLGGRPVFAKGKGCDQCKMRGFLGRTAIEEVFVMDRGARPAGGDFTVNDLLAWGRNATRFGCLDSAIPKVLDGTVDPRDIEAFVADGDG